MRKLALHWKIFISITLACLAGYYTNINFTFLGINFYQAYGFIGTIFLNALKMIIVPLVSASIVTGISGIGGDSKVIGRLGIKTVVFYISTSLIAILIGLVIVNIFTPGIKGGIPVGRELGMITNVTETVHQIEGRGLHDVIGIFQRMIPANIVEAAAQGNMLGIIFFSLLFGLFMSRIDEKYSEPLKVMWQGVFDTMMLFTMWVMKYIAPIGVFGLVAHTIAETGFKAFQPLFFFFFSVMVGLSIHVFIVLPCMLKFIGKVSPIMHFKAMIPALLTAFSTSSSSATLPLTMECVEKNANVSNRVSSFVLPLGATINMDGTALYECVAAMFLAQAYGIELTFSMQFTVVALALITSIGVAGVPAAGTVAILIVLTAIGLPLEGIGIIMITERFIDMIRTAVNIFGDSCGAVIIASSEGEKSVLADNSWHKFL